MVLLIYFMLLLSSSSKILSRSFALTSTSTILQRTHHRANFIGNQYHPRQQRSVLARDIIVSRFSKQVSSTGPLFQRMSTNSKDIVSTNDNTNKRAKLDEHTTINDNDVDVQDEEVDIDTATTSTIDNLPRGIPDSYSIINHTTVPPTGFTNEQIEQTFTQHDINRLKLQPNNITIPVALSLLLSDQFPTLTNARKAVRRRRILLHRGPLITNEKGEDNIFDKDKLAMGQTDDRVFPGDTLAVQVRMEHNYDECKNHDSDKPFHLPVVYEDDHFAIVNKPEGIVVFSHKNGGFGRENVNSCLPWVLTPPKPGVVSVMRRPGPVHRIDRGTSGLLVCAKTKPAMVELAMQFRERKAKKTYTAIVNGDIKEPKESQITSQEAINMGVCIQTSEESSCNWQLIDYDLELEGKPQSAVTIWRTLKQWSGVKDALNETVSLVELKPKSGRHHQLRRHMAWVSKCPLLGDKRYDGGGLVNKEFQEDGFYLCSTEITLEHPYYNTELGRKEFDSMKQTKHNSKEDVVVWKDKDTDLVMVRAKIPLPDKFKLFTEREASVTSR